MSTTLEKEVLWPASGRYVVAVSGGVDSVTLLDLVAKRDAYDLEVAYFNHGWTPHGDQAAQLVERLATHYGLPFYSEKAQGNAASEAGARKARYDFLRRVKNEVGAAAILTAHHHDDLIETVILNLRRGTGRRGLTPFMSQPDIFRPLLHLTKADVEQYAMDQALQWLEDPTNTDTTYARNAVRKELAGSKRLMVSWDQETMNKIMAEATHLNSQIDAELKQFFTAEDGGVSAQLPLMRRLPIATLQELIVCMAQVARPGTELDRRTVEALAVDIKTGRLRTRRELTLGLFVHRPRGTVTVVFTSGKAVSQA